MNYTDKQLKQALADMLPEKIEPKQIGENLYWKFNFDDGISSTEILDTELLHLCWLVEKGLNPEQKIDYIEMLGRGEDEESYYPAIALASDWRWRVAALAVLKGIEI